MDGGLGPGLPRGFSVITRGKKEGQNWSRHPDGSTYEGDVVSGRGHRPRGPRGPVSAVQAKRGALGALSMVRSSA